MSNGVCFKNYLSVRGIKHFTEHDGFRTNKPVNLKKLEQEIKEKTRYDLKVVLVSVATYLDS